MARVELNIVALGDFKSVNTQIAALKTQVDNLNKSLSGVGLTSTSNLTKQLQESNAAFKAAMLSSGQFTANTVKLKAETDKFGESLVNGKLKLTEYFSIIKNGTSNASAQMRALAVEQTKLQNSIVQSDPTKQGVMSVFTPTKINQVANATKIAANMQNIYNLAVDKGTQSLINWGKNTQWAGRQLTVGMTVPLTIFGSTAMKTFQDVNDQLVRLQKVYGTGLVQPTKQALTDISNQVTQLSRDLASSMGIAAKDTAAMAADLAAVGLQGNDLINATREAMRLSKLGEMDTQQAMQTTISLQNVYKLNTNQLADAVNFLNAVENQTSTSLQDLAAGIPKVGPIVQQLGGSFKDTAVMMVAMKEAGVPAAQSANAIKSAIASLINPTKGAENAFAAFHINLKNIATSTGGNPVEMIMQLQQALKGIAPLAQAQLIEKLFGKFQEARIQALITNLGAVGSQTKTAFDLMNASSSQLGQIAASEMATATESVTGKFKRATETLKADLIPVGQKIMEIATTLMNFGNSVANVFSGLPGPVKTVLGIIAGGVALAGPIIMFTGVLANFVGYLLKGLFAMKDLVTGTKTFGQLFTPEIIASQNAADLFSKSMLEDATAVDVLDSAVRTLTLNLEAMARAMTTASTTGFLEKAALSIPFIAPKMANGGVVPGSSAMGDVRPALLTGGETVIPVEQSRAYAPLLGAILDNNVSRHASGINAYPEYAMRMQLGRQNMGHGSGETAFQDVLSPMALRIGEARGMMPSPTQVKKGSFDPIVSEYTGLAKQFTDNLNAHFKETYKNIVDADERFAKAWTAAGKSVEKEVNSIQSEVDRGVVRKTFGLDSDVYGTIPTMSRRPGGTVPERGRAAVQASSATGYRSYTQIRPGAKSLWARMTGQSASDMQMGHVFGPQQTTIEDLSKLPNQTSAVRNAAKTMGVNIEKQVGTGINEASQAASPSKEIKQATTNMVDGAIEGINQAKPRIKNAVNAAFEEALASASAQSRAGGTVSAAENVLATETSPGMAAVSSPGRFAKLNSFRTAVRSKMPKMLTGRFGGLGLGLGLQVAQQFAQPLINKMPGGSIANDAISGASYGAFLGPEGAAAGAAIGAVIGGLSKLISTHKHQQEVAKAAFTSSAAAATIFGNAVADAGTPTDHLSGVLSAMAPKVNDVKTQIQQFTDEIGKLPKDDPMSLLLDKLKSTGSSSEAAKLAKAFADTQVAINGMDPKKAQQMLDLYLKATGHSDMVGKVKVGSAADSNAAYLNSSGNKQGITSQQFVMTGFRQGHMETKTASSYKDLTSGAQNTADKIAQVANQAINTKSLDDYNAKIKAIQGSYYNTTEGAKMYAMSIANQSKKAGDANDVLAKSITTMSNMGLTLSQIIALEKDPNSTKMIDKLVADQKKGDLKAVAADMAAINKSIAGSLATPAPGAGGAGGGGGGGGGGSTSIFSGTTAEKAMKKLLEARVKDENVVLKGMNDQLKVYKQQAAEAKRILDYENQRFSLMQDQKTALMSGNYLGAAELKQQSTALTVDFNSTTKENQMQAAIDSVQARADQFATALADLNDAIANGISKIDASISKVASMPRIAGTAGGTGTVTVNNHITISGLDNPQAIAAKVAAQAQSGTTAGVAAAKKTLNGKPVVTTK
jgi:TP901 family phage tail tape measure protein